VGRQRRHERLGVTVVMGCDMVEDDLRQGVSGYLLHDFHLPWEWKHASWHPCQFLSGAFAGSRLVAQLHMEVTYQVGPPRRIAIM
jgi:hypothetical protein